MTKVQAQRHMAPQLLKSLGKEVAMKFLLKFIWLLEPLEKQFLSLGVMTKVQAQRHMDGPAIIEVLGQRSCNEVFAEVYMVAGTFGKAMMMKVQARRHMDGPAIIEVLGQRNRNEVFVEIYMTIFFSRLLEPLEKQFLSLGVMTKVQAPRHMDGPAIIEVPGQRSRNEVLAKIYMVAGTFGKAMITKVQAQRHMDGPAIIEVLGQRNRNEVLVEIYMTIFFSRLLEPLEKQFLSLGVMTKVQAPRHMDGPAIIEVPGQRSRYEVLAEIYMTMFFSRLLEPLEKQFLSLGVMTKVQAQRHMDDPAIIEVLGQKSRNEVLAEIYMIRSDINLTLNQLCGISFYCVLFSCCHITILHNEFNVVVEHKRISYFLCLAALHVWKTIFFSRLLEPLEKQFLSLGVMTKVQAQRHMDDLAITEVLGQRSRNEVLAEIYMHVWKTIFFSKLLEPLEKQFLRLGVMTKVQVKMHMDGPAIIEVPGQRSRNEVLAEIYMTIFFSRLLEPLEKQFLSLGVMTKVQAQRHMDGPAIIEVLGQRSRNEVLAEIYMVWKTIFFSRLLEPLEKQFLSLGVMMKVQAQRHMDGPAIIEVLGQRSRNEVLAEIYMVWKTIFFSRLLEPLEKQFLRLGVMTKVQEQRHMDGPAIIEVLGQRSRNEVLAEIYMTIFFSRLLEPLENQFLSLGVMTKVQAQRHMDGPAIIEFLGQRSRNEVLAEIYMGSLGIRTIQIFQFFKMARTITILTCREVRRNQLREEIQEIEYKSAYGIDGHVRRLDRLFWKLEQEEFPVLDNYMIWALMHSLLEYSRVIADYVWGVMKDASYIQYSVRNYFIIWVKKSLKSLKRTRKCSRKIQKWI
ncbi:uncharacterized protein LOC122056615 isoform X1 [Zingiber officinale]|uniref:uncharacterized protein LOC122056615 isoform X1 n=3 Tax=Zingiber officinale TaxID=94328 RepID=UPI001C4D7485|nr:uncharacterized protein LOC122056615 isoform X1 [Zingiber officinale]XP_042474572.1 uncharacterized protein LOC122056615 isoform X1 [Zingiber officinale]XP_042474573.1 uncharacterized protein LOC122056615 isoform X1 [Zingiber officinale]XP_042474575.1 uncharacterized protein LOC122056615 isoform X1 [Zingiber officinale]XP_042474576.1 uncharacterized protein LOC122056615 isoform X1 [Zingiber officinale]XP_042474577.1 uncharacterized protein LOC122056615 isoform X1 [Zingiber officinale]XP_04